MTTKLALGDAKLTVQVAQLLASCLNFEEQLPYKIRSLIRVNIFRIFVAVLEGALLAVTTENMNNLCLLCEEFGFASLLSQVTNFISSQFVVNDEARKRVSCFEERNTEQYRELCSLQDEVLDLRVANKARMR
jgi:hypothetical protein